MVGSKIPSAGCLRKKCAIDLPSAEHRVVGKDRGETPGRQIAPSKKGLYTGQCVLSFRKNITDLNQPSKQHHSSKEEPMFTECNARHLNLHNLIYNS